MHGRSRGNSSAATEHGAAEDNLRPCISAHELIICHVCKTVQLQFIGFINLVGHVDVFYVLLEHTEPVVFLVEAALREVVRDIVVAPPPLVQVPEALLGGKVAIVEVKALGCPYE